MRCDDCRFWAKKDDHHGKCHRNPPTEISVSYHGFFPNTSPDDWCGEFTPISTPPKITLTNPRPRVHSEA